MLESDLGPEHANLAHLKHTPTLGAAPCCLRRIGPPSLAELALQPLDKAADLGRHLAW